MRIRTHLRSPQGSTVIRDAVDGVWEEPSGSADLTIGQGWFSLPGLVDAHAHFAAPVGKDWQSDSYQDAVDRTVLALRAGVLLALDKGWSNLDTIKIIENIPPSQRPEIEAAGIINAVRNGYWADFAHELTPDTFESGIKRSIDEGRGWVKLIGDWPRRGLGPVANFDEEQLRTAVQIAEASGFRVAIHTMAREAPGMAVQAGVHSVEHGLFLSDDDVGLLGARGGMWVPTILRMEAVVAQVGSASTGGRLLVEGLDNVKKLMPGAAEAGVALLAGTDVTVGAHDVALEVLKMVEYGLPVPLALDAVSLAGHAATGRPAQYEVGSAANAVFFAENPLDEIAVLRHPARVLRLGRIVG